MRAWLFPPLRLTWAFRQTIVLTAAFVACTQAAAAPGSRRGKAIAPDLPPSPARVELALPEALTFQLEDGRHQTPGLSLSFALPRSSNYTCASIEFRQERRGKDEEIVLVGVRAMPDQSDSLCRMAKEPAPIRERVVLPAEPGSYRIIFVSAGRRDTWSLDVTPDAVTMEPAGPVGFTACEQVGRFLRVGPSWLWLDLWFITSDSAAKMRKPRDELLQKLQALGAKPFVPPPGRYLMDGFVRPIPAEARRNPEENEEHFFLWDGDWAQLRNLVGRYAKYAKVGIHRPVMQLWLSSRDHVQSTYGGL
jgi:hypothetical protein